MTLSIRYIANNHVNNFKRIISKKSNFVKNDRTIVSSVANTISPEQLNSELILYFWDAHQHYANRSKTTAFYPGVTSINGTKSDGIEGITRLLPLWASCVSVTGISSTVRANMIASVRLSLLNGTNPSHSGYWGRIDSGEQIVCEAADIALALWLSKDDIWNVISRSEQQQIIDWLKQCVSVETVDNNWHLFVILIDIVLANLDDDHKITCLNRYERIKSFYVGDGVFRDGSTGNIDLYNAWAFHYSLFWINEISPSFDTDFIKNTLMLYAEWYQYLFTENGFPVHGRSACYRMAASCPMLINAHYQTNATSVGIAKSCHYYLWKYFIANGGLTKGRPSLGFFSDDSDFVDLYSGAASSFWSARSLVLYQYLENKINWESYERVELPYNSMSKTIELKRAKIIISKEDGVVKLLIQNTFESPKKLKGTNLLKHQCRNIILGMPARVPDKLFLLQNGHVFSDLRHLTTRS